MLYFCAEQKTRSVLDYAGAGFGNHLANQFLETLIYSILSTLTGILIFEFLHKYFNTILGKSPDAGSELIYSTFLFQVPAIIIIVSMAGLYPLLITQFRKKIRSIISGQDRNSENTLISRKRYKILKTLITVQYIFSISLLITVAVVNKQVQIFNE